MSQALTKIQDFENMLGKLEFSPMLPSHIPEEKFKQVVLTAVQKNPSLLDLNRSSLFNACKDCAADGLIPDGREAALVPYKGTVRYTPMIQGITKKARNSGEIATIDAQVVYENDEFDSWIDEKGPHFKHKRTRGDRGKSILTYAYAITKDGAIFFEEISEEQMQAIEKCSPANNSPWKGPFKDEMKRKSAMRRLCKYRLPSSTDIDTLMHRDDEMYEFDNKEKEQEKEPQKSETLEDVVSKYEDEQVEDAEYEEEQKTTPINTPTGTTVTGIVTDIKSKSGTKKDGNPYTKIGCKIGEKYYSTFDKKMNEMFVKSKEDQIPINIKFEEKKVDNNVFYNITEASLIMDNNISDDDGDVPI